MRAGLWNLSQEGSAPLSDAEWTELLALARSHSVQALIADGTGLVTDSSRPPLQQIASLAVATSAIERGNEKVDAVLRNMAAFWKKEGVVAVLLKGQGLARFYSKPEHRTPGDIDWYFPGKENFWKAFALVKAKGLNPEIDGDGDFHYNVNGVVVEHHKRWCDVSNPFKKNRVSSVEDRYGFDQGPDYSVPAPLTNLVQLNAHILKHVLIMGVGWRQLCDLALATMHYSGQYSAEEFRHVVKSLGLMRWTKLLYGVLSKYLGLDKAYMPIDPLTGSDVDRLASLIMRCGNFGMDSGRNMLTSYLSAGFLLCRYVPDEMLWRPVMLAANRCLRLLKKEQ